MTLAEYQQAQKDIADIKAQIAQLRDVVAKGVPAVRGIYGADLPTQEPKPNDFSGSPIDIAMQEQQARNKNFANTSLLGDGQQPVSTTAIAPQDPAFSSGASNAEQVLGASGIDELRYRERASIGTPDNIDPDYYNSISAGGNGYTPPVLERQNEKPISQSIDESATAFGASMADAATMGLTGEMPKKFQRAIDQSPISSFVGTMAGYAPAFTGLDIAAGAAIPAIAGKGIAKNIARGAIAGGTQDTADQLVRTGKIDPERSVASLILGAGADFLIPSAWKGAKKGFKSIKEARAAIKDVGKSKVDVPETPAPVQEPAPIQETKPPQPEAITESSSQGEQPIPKTAEEVVGKAKGSISLADKPIGKKFYRNYRSDEGGVSFEEVPNAKPITIKGFEDADFFVSKDRKGEKWVVSEGRLGSKIADGRTRVEAIAKANQLFESHPEVTIDKFNERLNEKASEFGVSPRYQNAPPPTELHSGINPFKIIDDYMTKRKLVNPVGTPEHVLSGKGIVEPFRKAQESMRNELKSRGELLQKTFEGVKRESDEDVNIFRKLDDPKAILDAREQVLRKYADDLLEEINKHRIARGQDPVKYRKGYITHLPNEKLLIKLIEEMEKEGKVYGDTPMPKRFRFQFEKAREGNAPHRVSAIDALEVYTKAALKDIYIGDALAETIPKVEALGDKPIVRKVAKVTPDGKTINLTYYDWTNSPIMTERGYAESFIKGQMNLPTVGQRNLEAMFGIKPNTSTRTALGISATFYRSLLGLAFDSGVKNLTQGINTMAEMGVLPTLKGYAKLSTPKGLKTARAEHLLEDFNPMLMEGHDLPMRSKVGRAIGKGATATLNAPMKVAEFINRGAAYHAAYEVYIKKGMPIEQAHEAARAAVRKTQFSYSKVDTSPALRGPFARIASQFLSYPIKQSEMMYNWAVKPGEQGKLIRYFLYTGMAVMGAKYAGVDLSGIFFDPIKMVDPNSKEGFQLPGSDKRVAFDFGKLTKTGYTPQGFAPTVSIPADFIKSQMSDQESTREYGREKALFNVLPGGRYGKKVYDVLTERDELGARDRKTRENTDKDKVLKLLGGRSTDREAETSRRELTAEVEKKYYATRQKLIDLRISGDMDEFTKVLDDFRDKYPFLYGRLMKGFDAAVKEERKKKGMTTDERFFDNSLRKQIDANL